MGFWDDIYGGIDKTAFGGYLPGGPGPDDPTRTGGEYGGINGNNFNLPGYNTIQDRNNGYINQIDQRGQSGFRPGQGELARMLLERARGRGPSVGEETLRQQNEMAQRQQLALAAGANPANAAMAQRLASEGAANASVGLGGAAALTRATEANQAAGLAGQVFGQGRQQDITGQAMNDQARAELLRQGLAASQAQQQGGQAYEQNRTQRYATAMGAPTNSENWMKGITKALPFIL